ncbi:MAG: ATP-binding cassette domain-containing protein, partial [Acidimicrobiales bacterium]
EEIRSLAGAHTATPEGLTRLSRVPIALSALGIAGLQSTRVDALSGGQQRRVLLAGLLARGSSVIVLDEPLAGLDDEGRVQLTEVVDSLRRRGTAVVVVTHDPTWGHDRLDQMLRIEHGRIAPIEVSSS